MIKPITLIVEEMPCTCNVECNLNTFAWNIIKSGNEFHFSVICKKCSAAVSNLAKAFIQLENKETNETVAIKPKQFPITIKGAREDFEAYLATLVIEEEIVPVAKEYVH